jgi:hypothetical protein
MDDIGTVYRKWAYDMGKRMGLFEPDNTEDADMAKARIYTA